MSDLLGTRLIAVHELDREATGGRTGTICEPTAARRGPRLFVTGNWFASYSLEGGGGSWTFVDPNARFEPPPGTEFCCDQVTLYDPGRRLWIWILQYTVPPGGGGLFRIAFTSDSSFPNGWFYWDITPEMLDPRWQDGRFDFPNAALTASNLYVSGDIAVDREWVRSAVMRFPLPRVTARSSISMQFWAGDDIASPRLTQGAHDTMYWSDVRESRVRLYAWPDAAAAPIGAWSIEVSPWSTQISSKAPDGANWLARADDRVRGSVLSGGNIALMWMAGADDDHVFPYIRVVRISEATKRLVDEPDIWGNSQAWAYPAAAPSASGRLGFTASWGGGISRALWSHPSHVVGFRDDDAGVWRAVLAKRGGSSPDQPAWGDYVTCYASTRGSNAWLATGFTLEGGSDRRFVVPRVAEFEAVRVARLESPLGAAALDGDGPCVFAIDDRGELWMRRTDGRRWSWANLGFPPDGKIVAPMGAAAVGGRPHVWVTGRGGRLWLLRWNGQAWSWTDQGTPPEATIDTAFGALVADAGRPFAWLTADGQLWLRRLDGGTWVWEPHGTPQYETIDEPAGAVVVDDERPYMWFLDGERALWSRWTDGSRWRWSDHGRPPGDHLMIPLGAALLDRGRPCVWAVGESSAVWSHWWDGTEWQWTSHGQPIARYPDAAVGRVLLSGRVVWMLDVVRDLWSYSWSPSAWGEGWVNHGKPTHPGDEWWFTDIAGPAGTSADGPEPSAWVLGADGQLWQRDAAHETWRAHGAPQTGL
ncbi:MAG: hypothetical protein M3340_07635 [Actinomycetota bacterium]|nr:hypothetical protein [Actinomycetota bacterium]